MKGPADRTIWVHLYIRNALVRRGLFTVLDGDHELTVYDQERPAAHHGSPDPGPFGSTVTVVDSESLQRAPDKHTCVLVTDDDQNEFLLSAVKQGVRGIVTESRVEEDLPRAVRATAIQNAFVSEPLARFLMDCLANRLPERTSQVRKAMARLSQREIQVLQLLGNARSNAHIAGSLKISEATVRSHIYHILTKLDLQTRTEAVLFGHHFTVAETEDPSFT